jgi:histidinol dehydrogenase
MIKIINLKETNGKSEESIDNLLAKRNGNKIDVSKTVKEILEDVKENGDIAIKKYTLKFDNVKIDNLKVTKKEIEEAYKLVDKKLIDIMKKAAKNIYDFHKKQKIKSIIYNKTFGIKLGMIRRPISSVGIYVPARYSTTSFFSSYEYNTCKSCKS